MDASLTWTRDQTFIASSASQWITIDGNSTAGPSPVQAFAFAIAGCMAVDVIEILVKGRHSIHAMEVAFHGERAPTPPHRFTTVHLAFVIRGEVANDVVARAISLSHEKYCSVSNSLRGDIAFTTEFEVQS